MSARKAARSGVLWGLIFGIAIASSEVSYVKIYKTSAQRDALAATYGSNKAVSALFGPAPQLQTVGGFTVFKISMTLMVLGAVVGAPDQHAGCCAARRTPADGTSCSWA